MKLEKAIEKAVKSRCVRFEKTKEGGTTIVRGFDSNGREIYHKEKKTTFKISFH